MRLALFRFAMLLALGAGTYLGAATAAVASEVTVSHDWSMASESAPGVQRVADRVAVDLDSRRDGTWSEHGDVRRWELTIRVPGARGVAAQVSFEAVEGAALELAGATLVRSKARHLSRFTPGESIRLVLTAPVDGPVPLVRVTSLRAAPVVLQSKAAQPGDWVPYACHATAERDDNARASVGVLVNGTNFCSATLINNRMGAGGAPRPYILLSEHCQGDGEGEDVAQNLTLYWKGEKPCGSADPGDGALFSTAGTVVQDVEGTHVAEWTRAAIDSQGDMWLVELDRWPQASAEAWLAGFDARDRVPDAGVLYVLHYGGIKPLQLLSTSDWRYDARRDRGHGDYDQIITETGTGDGVGDSTPGSSGSGLYSGGSNLLIGVLGGGGVTDQYSPTIGSVWTTGGLGDFLVPNPDDAAARVLAGQAAPIPVEPALTFASSKATVTTGESVQLSWTATNVDTCVASGAWTGTKALTGTETVTPTAGTKTYTLTCDGDNGAVTKSATVTATAASSGGGGGGGGGGGAVGWALLAVLAAAGLRRRTR